MLATPPVPPSSRSFYFVMTVASLLVGAAIGAQFARYKVDAPPPTIVMIEPTPAPVPPPTFAQPPPEPVWTTGIESCDLYIHEVEQLARCEKFPDDARASIRDAISAMKDAWDDIPADQREMTASACQQAVEAIRASKPELGCPQP